MSTAPVTPFLRLALSLDAAVSGVTALLMAAGATLLAGWTHLPEALLSWVGLGLLPYVAIVAWMATRATLPRAAVWVVIACNALYAADCVWMLVSGFGSPNTLGQAFVAVQAVAVAVFAELQWMALRRATGAVIA
ncbi:MAG: hypothetical protein K1X51_18390 [Rhodospirillaceae bacterium]|nr:hypothetical protein [Rhodospirillaceae bacterium]